MAPNQVNVDGHLGSAKFVIDSRVVSKIGERAPFNLQNMRAILFDLDRHLVNTDLAFDAWWNTGVAVLALELGRNTIEVESWLHQAEASFRTIFFFHRLDLVAPVVEIASFLKLDMSLLSKKIFQSAHKAYRDALQVTDDILDMLAAARDFATCSRAKLALVTGGSRNHTLDKLDAIGIGSYFDVIFCGGGRKHPFEDDPQRGYIVRSPLESKLRVTPPGVTKRDTSCYLWVLSELEVPAKYVIVSGDHPLEDVHHIQQLGGYGAQAIWYNNKALDGVKPHLLLLNPIQLTRMFREN
jgi:phosphoglycolate phosphatase-like HAD superfamily hydrolase